MRRFGAKDAMRNHMLDGNSVSILEAILLWGAKSQCRNDQNEKGWLFNWQRRVRMAKILARINKYANAETPADLPLRIFL